MTNEDDDVQPLDGDLTGADSIYDDGDGADDEEDAEGDADGEEGAGEDEPAEAPDGTAALIAGIQAQMEKQAGVLEALTARLVDGGRSKKTEDPPPPLDELDGWLTKLEKADGGAVTDLLEEGGGKNLVKAIRAAMAGKNSGMTPEQVEAMVEERTKRAEEVMEAKQAFISENPEFAEVLTWGSQEKVAAAMKKPHLAAFMNNVREVRDAGATGYGALKLAAQHTRAVLGMGKGWSGASQHRERGLAERGLDEGVVEFSKADQAFARSLGLSEREARAGMTGGKKSFLAATSKKAKGKK